MKSKFVVPLCFLVAIVVAVLPIVNNVCATLGEPISSIESDRKIMEASRNAPVARAGYTIHEFQSGKTTVREYANPSGIVFAIAWDGFTHPDLSQLLGPYVDEYATARSKVTRPKGRQALRTVESDRIVVQTWGHMRSLHGRAWIINSLPEGVSTDDVK